MATVVLQYVGAALGTMLGGPIGAIIGRAAGAIAGNMLDQSLFGSTKHIEGPRLTDTRVMASTEGTPVPRVWGRTRLSGQVIWATQLEEITETSTGSTGGKGGPKVENVSYSYFGNFAVALCEGPISHVGRVWADGKEVDVSGFHWRLHTGGEAQLPDSLIVAKEGPGRAPAYRGIAYVVFERLPLADFGNRLPQLSFEVFKPAGGAEAHVRAVNIIPGSTEFGYDPKVYVEQRGDDETRVVNSIAASAKSDWRVSIDDLTATCDNLSSTSLVVAWFGNDLRCAACHIRPGVETPVKATTPDLWTVAGVSRGDAHQVSWRNGNPAYGGTPNDASVIRALQDIKARGLKAVFYPFVLMDIAAGNNLPNPYGGTGQDTYPWRGRLTCDPAPGRPSSPDKTMAAMAQIDAFMGNAATTDFSIGDGAVHYAGPADWGYRRMVLHYANLCKLAGGVDAFLIGSEFRGLSAVRGNANSYPFVQALRQLAAEVKAILPGARISYAADWSEYFGHQPADGSGDVTFHLDPLWADPAIDFIGIDNYMPLSDWRDGLQHLDRQAGAYSIYDLNYLKSRIAGGEGFDWFYASEADRHAQTRTAISDGAYGKPWVFRYKDLLSWWSNLHFNRSDGVQSGSHTAWVPQSKPIWFTETGCPAVNKGSNQPNVFVDEKSSESLLPYHSNGQRDDFMQVRFITAVASYWSAAGAHNPVSPLYGGTMVDATRIFFWAWDARPFPAFPLRTDIWSDGGNYARGHWLNGRVGAVPLDALIRRVCAAYGVTDIDTAGVEGLVDGFVIDRVMTAREALELLLRTFSVDASDTGGTIAFRSRRVAKQLSVTAQDIVETDEKAALHSLTRAQEIDLPRVIRMAFLNSANDYRRAAVEAVHGSGGSAREAVLEVACAIDQSVAQARAEIALQEIWAGRETLELTLPPRFALLEPGDVIDVDLPQGARAFRIEAVTDGVARKITARRHAPALYDAAASSDRQAQQVASKLAGRPDLVFLDLPLAEAEAEPALPWVAVSAKPWVGAVALSRYTGETVTAFNRMLPLRATKGRLLDSLNAGPLAIIDRGSRCTVTLDYGALQSVSDEELLAGANTAVVGSVEQGWEIIQFGRADLVADSTYRLSRLLRGQMGSEPEMLMVRGPGTRFVLLNAAVVQPGLSASQGGLEIKWKATPSRLITPFNTVTVTHDGKRLGLRPRLPARLAAARDGDDVVFTWIRQTRLEGDAWESNDVPLGEQGEAYRVEILESGATLRVAETTTPSFRYSAALRTADYPVEPAAITLRVAQISATYGVGAPLTRTLHV